MTGHAKGELSPSRHSLGGLLVGIGFVLIGGALLVIAAQWQTDKGINPNSPAVSKAGFAFASAVEQELNTLNDKHSSYLLDRDTGRVWKKKNFQDVWEEVYVEGITPPESPASKRK